VNIVALLPIIVLIGAMFLMTRSAKNKQRKAESMRNQMQPGSGVRTIGGMYATVKEVNDDTILLEVAPGVHAVYAKNAVGVVMEDAEYNRIVHGIDPEDTEIPVVPDDASSLIEVEEAADEADDADEATVTADADEETADAEQAAGDPAEADADRVDLGKADTEGSADAPRTTTESSTDAK
jgi:preprotein translocase subunit YajC